MNNTVNAQVLPTTKDVEKLAKLVYASRLSFADINSGDAAYFMVMKTYVCNKLSLMVTITLANSAQLGTCYRENENVFNTEFKTVYTAFEGGCDANTVLGIILRYLNVDHGKLFNSLIAYGVSDDWIKTLRQILHGWIKTIAAAENEETAVAFAVDSIKTFLSSLNMYQKAT